MSFAKFRLRRDYTCVNFCVEPVSHMKNQTQVKFSEFIYGTSTQTLKILDWHDFTLVKKFVETYIETDE